MSLISWKRWDLKKKKTEEDGTKVGSGWQTWPMVKGNFKRDVWRASFVAVPGFLRHC